MLLDNLWDDERCGHQELVKEREMCPHDSCALTTQADCCGDQHFSLAEPGFHHHYRRRSRRYQLALGCLDYCVIIFDLHELVFSQQETVGIMIPLEFSKHLYGSEAGLYLEYSRNTSMPLVTDEYLINQGTFYLHAKINKWAIVMSKPWALGCKNAAHSSRIFHTFKKQMQNFPLCTF